MNRGYYLFLSYIYSQMFSENPIVRFTTSNGCSLRLKGAC